MSERLAVGDARAFEQPFAVCHAPLGEFTQSYVGSNEFEA
jgi:hypothetical protein